MRYISEVNGEFRVHEDLICVNDAIRAIVESQLLASKAISNDVRFTEQNFGIVIINKCQNPNMDLSKCVGQGMDLGIEEKRNQGNISFNTSYFNVALYSQCMMHSFNLCTPQSVNVASVRNCKDVVRGIKKKVVDAMY